MQILLHQPNSLFLVKRLRVHVYLNKWIFKIIIEEYLSGIDKKSLRSLKHNMEDSKKISKSYIFEKTDGSINITTCICINCLMHLYTFPICTSIMQN